MTLLSVITSRVADRWVHIIIIIIIIVIIIYYYYCLLLFIALTVDMLVWIYFKY